MAQATPRPPCRYANRPEVSEDEDGRPVHSDRWLCAWAHFHPAAVAPLSAVPPWLQRSALAGVLMRPQDCGHCAFHEPGPPVEGP